MKSQPLVPLTGVHRALAGAAVLFASLLGAAAPLAAGEFLIHDGDQPVVFLGDSITEQRMYTTYIEAFVLARFPTWKLSFRNIGWGGDTAWLGQRKNFDNGMKRDVLPLKPVTITIDFGMNDARGGDNNLARYIEYSTKLVQQLKATGAGIALVTPSPEEKFEPDQPGGSAYNKMLWKYSLALKDIAAKEGVLFIDQYTPFIKVIEDGRKAEILTAKGNPRLIPDAVHPNWGGHLVMAAAILKGLDAPALVSSAELDSAARSVTAAKACQIEIQAANATDFSFKRIDTALPWPLNPETALVLSIPGFTPLDDLSRYQLKVTGLTEAFYNLLIDDKPAAMYSKEALATGINLSNLPGPITDQCTKLFQKVIEKNNTYFARWRTVQVFEAPAWLQGPEVEAKRATELARMDAQIAKQEEEINLLRQPVPHLFTLRPATVPLPAPAPAVAPVPAPAAK